MSSNISSYKFKYSLLKSLLSILFSVKLLYYSYSYSYSDDIQVIFFRYHIPPSNTHFRFIKNYSSHELKVESILLVQSAPEYMQC